MHLNRLGERESTMHGWTLVEAGIYDRFHVTYQAACRGMPAFWRDAVEEKPPDPSGERKDP